MKIISIIALLLATQVSLAQTNTQGQGQLTSSSQSDTDKDKEKGESYFKVFVKGSVKCTSKPDKTAARKCVDTLHICEAVTSKTKDIEALKKCVDELP